MPFEKQGFVYLLANSNGGVLYVGVTNDLKRRVWEYRHKLGSEFTQRYHVSKLVYHEVPDAIEAAIYREKKIKAGPKKRKIALINKFNPNWDDRYGRI